MRARSSQFPHQQSAVDRIKERRKVAVLLEPGYGKTAIALTAVSDLAAWPTLVIAPAQTAKNVWKAEAAEWDHLRNVEVTPIIGTASKRAKLLREASHVDVISYENLMWLSEQVDIGARYKALVFDELSKMKTAGSKRFRRMRARGVEIPIRIGLTGTPVGNHLLDLWGELYTIGGPEALGSTYGGFQTRFFQPGAYVNGRPTSWVLQGMKQQGKAWVHTDRSRATEREIHQLAAPWCYALPPQPEVKIPPVRQNLIRVDVPESARKALDELKKVLVTYLDDGLEIEALSAGAMSAKVRQIAGGAVYGEDGKWGPVHDAKLAALDDLLDELQGEPILLFYWYKHERDRIVERLGRRGAVFATAPDSPRWMESWNHGELEVLLAHPQSAGHGLNLQSGGHHVGWFTLPWSRELRVQGEGRLARTGQRSPVVMSHVFICGSVDEAVMSALDRKRTTEDALIGSLLYDDLL